VRRLEPGPIGVTESAIDTVVLDSNVGVRCDKKIGLLTRTIGAAIVDDQHFKRDSEPTACHAKVPSSRSQRCDFAPREDTTREFGAGYRCLRSGRIVWLIPGSAPTLGSAKITTREKVGVNLFGSA
jgi:hypothetical protein